MLGLYETIIRCQEYEKQWKNSKARHCSPSLTFATDITTSALPKKIGTKQTSKHAMGCTFQRSCTLGYAMHLHSSRETCERSSHRRFKGHGNLRMDKNAYECQTSAKDHGSLGLSEAFHPGLCSNCQTNYRTHKEGHPIRMDRGTTTGT